MNDPLFDYVIFLMSIPGTIVSVITIAAWLHKHVKRRQKISKGK